MKFAYLTLLLVAPAALAGGISSSGGENHAPADGAAWFLGDKPIRYCVNASPQFGLGAREAGVLIERAFRAWRDYADQKQLNAPGSEGSDSQIENSMHLGKVDMNAQALPACDGSEDLTFYLGITNDEVKSHFTEYANPVAFAEKTSFDITQGWGKGFLWIQSQGQDPVAPKAWANSTLLYGVFLHELGHVFGTSHVGDTIMAENVPILAGQGGWHDGGARDEGFFSHIDNRRELFLCETCDFSYSNKAGDPGKDPTVLPNAPTFKLLTGRDPKGIVRARVKGSNLASFRNPKLSLELEDDQGRISLDIAADSVVDFLTMSFGDSPVFKKSRNYSEWARHSNAVSFLAKIVTKSGQRVPVLIARNMGVSPLSIQLVTVKPGWVRYLFSAETY